MAFIFTKSSPSVHCIKERDEQKTELGQKE